MSTAPVTFEQYKQATDVLAQCGSQTKASLKLNISRSAFQNRLNRGKALYGEMDNGLPVHTPAAVIEPEPEADIPFEERLDIISRRNKARIEHARATSVQDVQVPIDGPYGICWFGDPHLDDTFADIEQVRADAAVIAQTPGLYGANGGDSINNWVGRLERLHSLQNVTAPEAWEMVRWFMNNLGIQWVVWLLGNHDVWNFGEPIFKEMNTRKILLKDWDAKIRLISPNGGVCSVWARHDFKGTSIYNELHGLKRAAMIDEHHDIYLGFHQHTWGTAQGELAGGREYALVRARGYKMVDDYAMKKQFVQQRSGQSVVTVIEPRNGQQPIIHLFKDVQRGADFLTYLRQKYGH